MFSRIEPAAIGSALVLLALIGGIGYGGYAVLNEVQRVQVSPVENTPVVLSELDPLAGVSRRVEDVVPEASDAAGVFTPPSDALDRLYRPQALDVPVLVARDGPISTLDPTEVGTFAALDTDPAAAGPWHPGSGPESPEDRAVTQALADLGLQDPATATPQVVADPKPGVTLVAVRPAWVRIRAADGTVIFEKTLEAGESYDLPQTEEAPTLRAGMSGSLYFHVNGQYYGPAGSGTGTIRDVAMSAAALTDSYTVADLTADPEAERVIAVAHAEQAVQTD